MTKDRLGLPKSESPRPVPILFLPPVVIVPLSSYCGLGSKNDESRNAAPTLSVPAALINLKRRVAHKWLRRYWCVYSSEFS
jgi:hypothetical protein